MRKLNFLALAIALLVSGSIWAQNVAKIGTTEYPTLAAAIEAATDGQTIKIIADVNEDAQLIIDKKSLTISSDLAEKPVIGAVLKITNNGNKTVTIEKVKFTPLCNDKNIIHDLSTCTNENDINQLVIRNCEFFITNRQSKNYSVVAICSTSGVVGSKLSFTNNIVRTDSYAETDKVGYRCFVVTTNTTTGTDYAASCYSYAKHIISNNTIQGNFYYAYVGGYAEFTNNTVDYAYYKETASSTSGGRAFQFRGAKLNNHGGQFDVLVQGNTFKNVKELFKCYELNTLIGAEHVSFVIADADDANANTFENIPTLCSSDANTASNFLSEYATYFTSGRIWTGIADVSIDFVLSKVKLTKVEDINEVLGIMTLSDGSQVETHTQSKAPDPSAEDGNGGRQGFYVDVPVNGQAGTVRLWYFASVGTKVYFLDKSDKIYSCKLMGGGSTTNASIMIYPDEQEPATASTWAETPENGHVYGKVSFSIATDEAGNTYYNSDVVVDKANGIITITPTGEAAAANAYISNISDIGDYSSLFITSNAQDAAPAGALKMVVPSGMGQINVKGEWPVVLATSIVNMNIYGPQQLTINAGASITGILLTTLEDAIGAAVINNGSIKNLFVQSRTDVTNNGTVTTLVVGDHIPGGTDRRRETLRRAYESVIVNHGTIPSVTLLTKVFFTNESTGVIQGVSLGTDAKLLFDPKKNEPYAIGTVFINKGQMCTANPSGRINILVSCQFINEGTIGNSERINHAGNHAEAGCDYIGGCIHIGYEFGVWHNGTIFKNTGTIYCGARHNGNAHQVYTFWYWGAKSGYGTTKPNITLINSGTIYGVGWFTPNATGIAHNIPAGDFHDGTFYYLDGGVKKIRSDYAVAEIGESKYATLAAAFAAAKDGDVIRLVNSFEEANAELSKNNVKLNFNGQEVTGNLVISGKESYVYGGSLVGNLTISEGANNRVESMEIQGNVIADAHNIVLKDCQVSGVDAITANEGASVSIEDGVFVGSSNVISATGDVSVMRGDFTGALSGEGIKLYGGSYSVEPIDAYLAAGYEKAEVAPKWIVSKKEAGKEAEPSGTPTTDWGSNATWSDNAVPVASDNVKVAANNVEVNSGTAAVAKSVEVEGKTLTIHKGGKLNVGDEGVVVSDGGKLIVEPGAVVTVGANGIISNNTEDVMVLADAMGCGSLLLNPETKLNVQPNAIVKMVAHIGLSGTAYTWHRFAMPVKELTSNWKKDPNYGTYLYGWDYTTKDWKNMSGSTNMEPFQGYTVTTPQTTPTDMTFTFEGQLVGNANSEIDFRHIGWSYFGNSYTGYIYTKTLLKDVFQLEGVEGSIWTWDSQAQSFEGASLQSIEEEKAEDIAMQIAPMQTFILKLNSGEGTDLNIDYANAIWGNPLYDLVPSAAPARVDESEVADDAYFKLSIATAGCTNIILMTENQANSDAFENGSDVEKKMNDAPSFNAYTVVATKNHSTLYTNNLLGKQITLATADETSFTLTVKAVTGSKYALKDLVTNETITLAKNETYSFTADAKSTTARFEVVSALPTGLEEVNASASKGIYTILGLYVGETSEWNNMPKGVYIVDGVKVIK